MTNLLEADARYELKFTLEPTRENAALYWLFNHDACFHDAYPQRRVNNVYFDSHDLDAFQENLSGVSLRVKNRLRWYGNTLDPYQAQQEAKIKKNKLGWKIAAPIKNLPSFTHTPWQDIVDRIRGQLPPQHQLYMLQHIVPVVISGYTRRYFVSTDKRVRVTFDTDHFVYDQRNCITPNSTAKANSPSPLVIEIKFAATDLFFGQRVAADFPAHISRHSKYAVAVNCVA